MLGLYSKGQHRHGDYKQLRSAKQNILSAYEHREVVDKFIKEELSAGRLVDPLARVTGSRGPTTSIPNSSHAGTVVSAGSSGLDLQRLEGRLQQFLSVGIADSTACSYASGQRRYLQYCNQFRQPPFPASEHLLMLFAIHLSDMGLRWQTIKSYSILLLFATCMFCRDPNFLAWMDPFLGSSFSIFNLGMIYKINTFLGSYAPAQSCALSQGYLQSVEVR